ncbi:putative short chain dehydrogenase [Encephalitozoon romaleae SJ-2008]|uniref:Short chain dehydrogenase n=1 Tax=Encephalitozoon romaleae (strain SJ-2008) TaxID=1178016 RepID=I7AUB9_ENCRO|nr:putative short chain dehydrogenase [Encephalitozoon romaleae SJ-2008]AFN84077.1 putative short chain dehydrogenase [Encephalitozoon romaleae SJ-2008]
MTAVLLLFGALIVIYFFLRHRARHQRHEISNKKILVVGGSSGLGLAFAQILKEAGNNVTITSRSVQSLELLRSKWGFETKVLDVNTMDSQKSADFDYIFCCAGISHPSYFADQSFELFKETMNTNYLGTVAVLKHYTAINKKPMRFIMIGSTLSLLTFPGFSSYSPSKAALLSLFYTLRDEMKELGVELYFYNTASIQTPGFEMENKTKPAYTKAIEGMISPSSARERAFSFLSGMKRRSVVASDAFTYLCQIRFECECLIDYLLFPVAVVAVFMSRIYVRWRFKAEKKMRGKEDVYIKHK